MHATASTTSGDPRADPERAPAARRSSPAPTSPSSRAFASPEDGIAVRAAHRSGARPARTRHEGDDRAGPGRGGGRRLRDRPHAATCASRRPKSSFGIPVARTLGNCLSGATYSRLVDLLGPGLVKDMLLTGRFVPGGRSARARAWSRASSRPRSIDASVREYAPRIAANAPLTMRATKEMIRRIMRRAGACLAGRGPRSSSRCVTQSPRFSAKAVEAFLAKRPPQWHRRQSDRAVARRQSRSPVAVDSRRSTVASTQGWRAEAALARLSLFERALRMHRWTPAPRRRAGGPSNRRTAGSSCRSRR